MVKLNANINRTAPATIAGFAATLGAVTVAPALVATIGFAGRINRTLNNGRSRLRLNLRNSSGNGFLRYGTRYNRHGGQWGDLHHRLRQHAITIQVILNRGNQKIVNYFIVNWELDKSLILGTFVMNRINAGLSLGYLVKS